MMAEHELIIDHEPVRSIDEASYAEILLGGREQPAEDNRKLERSDMWRNLISGRIRTDREDENTPKHRQLVESLLLRILSYENLPPELFTRFVERITIAREDVQAGNGNLRIGFADLNRREIILYPLFFQGSDSEIEFDREHVVAHELGELAFGHFTEENLLDGYFSHKADASFAIDGDYVELTRERLGERDAKREEFCETFGELLRSQTGLGMFARRLDRVGDFSRYTELLRTEGGKRQLDYLVHESYALRSYLLHSLEDLRARPDRLDEEEDGDLFPSLQGWDNSSHELDNYSASVLSPWATNRKKEPERKGLLLNVLSWLSS